MQYQKREKAETAVSPVAGVMLMLVVAIIIAAVVSGFAGGLIGNNNQKAPTLNMDVKIINSGSWAGSGFFATVTGVSKPIPTNEIKIVTAWTAANGGSPVSGGNTTVPNVINTFFWFNPESASFGQHWTYSYPYFDGLFAPFGGGPGVNASTTVGYGDTNVNTYSGAWQQFGNYSLVPGTSLTAPPAGACAGQVIGGTWVVDSSTGTPGRVGGHGIRGNPSGDVGYGVWGRYKYYPGTLIDPATAVLGGGWDKLRAGDKVNVKFIHIPTGKVIFQKDIPVKEG